MSFLTKLIIQEKVATVDFPEMDGFTVDVCFVGKDKLAKIRQQSLVAKFNKRSRTREEEVDSDKFLELYCEVVIKGWKGLTIKGLATLLPVNAAGMDPKEEVPYSPEDALLLLKNSTIFDQFVTDTLNDFSVFEAEEKAASVKN